MCAWGRHFTQGMVAALALLACARVVHSAAPPAEVGPKKPAVLTPAETLRATAESAEKQGDWEAAFSIYCRILLADRSPAARDKVSRSLRRAQQVRRHQDPEFRQFVSKLSLSEALNLYAELMAKLPTLYAERERASAQQLWDHGIEEFDRALGSPSFRRAYLEGAAADRIEAFRASLRGFWAKRPIGGSKEARTQLRHLTAAAAETFTIRSTSAVAIEFLCGACAGLDDYTVFLTPAQSSVESLPRLADLQAYGLYLSFRDGGLWVDGVVPNSWAAFHTGLHKNDRILRVNGRLLQPGTPDILTDALRNPVEGFHELEVVMPVPDMAGSVRLPVHVPTVYGAGLLGGKEGIAYVRIGAFRDSTVRELDDVLVSLKSQGMRTLILDLRANHGGPFASGVQVAQRFLPAGIIVATQGQVGEFANRVFSSDSGMLAWDVPLVLLVDGETASSAEVVAGALKDHGRATLIGLTTFGKGSVQFPVRLVALDDIDEAGRPRSRSGLVRVTIARFVSPRGTAITGQGVVPHLMELDPQRQLELAIERALELLPAMPTPMTMP